MLQAFAERGWCRFACDPALERWVAATLPAARAAVAAPENQRWLRCQGTWFVGVNALPNDGSGAVPGGLPLRGAAVDFIREELGHGGIAFESAQVSALYPGYPLPMAGESEAATRFRLKRDAAHVDGLRGEGPAKRRTLREHHAFILGIPLAEASAEASPVVVWEGSQEIMRAAFREAFAGHAPGKWGTVDVTEAYQAARRQVFGSCRRVAVPARPGEAYLIHRLALHGVAPWGEGATAGPDGRMVAYFRPEVGGPREWLERA
jgi:hypothetical protein